MHPINLVARLGRRLAAVVAECRDAQRRATTLRGAVDVHLPHPSRAPDTYDEFLYRTSGPLRREPSAARRLAGRAVR